MLPGVPLVVLPNRKVPLDDFGSNENGLVVDLTSALKIVDEVEIVVLVDGELNVNPDLFELEVVNNEDMLLDVAVTVEVGIPKLNLIPSDALSLPLAFIPNVNSLWPVLCADPKLKPPPDTGIPN